MTGDTRVDRLRSEEAMRTEWYHDLMGQPRCLFKVEVSIWCSQAHPVLRRQRRRRALVLFASIEINGNIERLPPPSSLPPPLPATERSSLSPVSYLNCVLSVRVETKTVEGEGSGENKAQNPLRRVGKKSQTTDDSHLRNNLRLKQRGRKYGKFK